MRNVRAAGLGRSGETGHKFYTEMSLDDTPLYQCTLSKFEVGQVTDFLAWLRNNSIFQFSQSDKVAG